jgi:hypothetical protein
MTLLAERNAAPTLGPRPSVNDVVRYVRIQRVRPNYNNENIINVIDVSVSDSAGPILISSGEVTPLFSGWYNWGVHQSSGILSTGNDPNARITLDLGWPRSIQEVVVINRTVAADRILGCELQTLNSSRGILQRWDFESVSGSAAAPWYRVGIATGMVLQAERTTPPVFRAPPPLPLPIPVVGVEFIRLQRVRPSPGRENIINIVDVTVYDATAPIEIVSDVLAPPFNAEYVWSRRREPGGVVQTGDDPRASITLGLGSARTVHEVVVFNRLIATERIVGCELQLLDSSASVLRSWDFENVSDSRASLNGAPRYRVGTKTNHILLPEFS